MKLTSIVAPEDDDASVALRLVVGSIALPIALLLLRSSVLAWMLSLSNQHSSIGNEDSSTENEEFFNRKLTFSLAM